MPDEKPLAPCAPVTPVGLVLAGGLARRMGGRPKGLTPFLGRPLIAHVAQRLRPQCAKLIISANDHCDAYQCFGDAVIADSIPGFAGPLAGVLAGLDFAQSWTDVISAPCDAPFLPCDLVEKLQSARRIAGAKIAVARSRGQVHWTVALTPTSLADDLRTCLRGPLRKMRDFFQSYPTAFCDFEEDQDPFFNINRPEDLRQGEIWAAPDCKS